MARHRKSLLLERQTVPSTKRGPECAPLWIHENYFNISVSDIHSFQIKSTRKCFIHSRCYRISAVSEFSTARWNYSFITKFHLSLLNAKWISRRFLIATKSYCLCNIFLHTARKSLKSLIFQCNTEPFLRREENSKQNPQIIISSPTMHLFYTNVYYTHVHGKMN